MILEVRKVRGRTIKGFLIDFKAFDGYFLMKIGCFVDFI